MHIFLKVGDDKTYTNHEFKGHYALELAILTLSEIYFGNEVRESIESILKSKIAESEVVKNIQLFRDIRNGIKRS